MVTPSFSETLSQFLKKTGSSKTALANAIGKTHGYIRKILLGYTPPTFEVCKKIVGALHLSREESLLLYRYAFLERMGDDRLFFDEIDRLTQAISGVAPVAPVLSGFPLHYGVVIMLRQACAEALILELQTLISTFVSETGWWLQSCTVTPKGQFDLVVGAPLSGAIGTWILELKSSTSRSFKTRFPKEIPGGGSIWSTDSRVFTLGDLPENSKVGRLSHTILHPL